MQTRARFMSREQKYEDRLGIGCARLLELTNVYDISYTS